MSYLKDDIETDISLWDIPPEAALQLSDFARNILGDQPLTTDVFSFADRTVEIPSEVEVARIEGGGTFQTSGQNILIHIESDEPVIINGRVLVGEQTAIIGGENGDIITLSNIDQVGTLSPHSDGAHDEEAPGRGIVYAGAGDDDVTGGRGDDTLVGESGDDEIDGGDGFDYSFVAAAKSEATIVVDVEEATEHNLEVSSVDGIDRFAGVEFVEFESGGVVLLLDDEGQAEIARLYETILDRFADYSGLGFWLHEFKNGASGVEIAAQMLSSVEYDEEILEDSTSLSDREFIDALYESGLDRSGEDSGIEFWVNALQQGAARADVAYEFAASDESEQLFDYINIITYFDFG